MGRPCSDRLREWQSAILSVGTAGRPSTRSCRERMSLMLRPCAARQLIRRYAMRQQEESPPRRRRLLEDASEPPGKLRACHFHHRGIEAKTLRRSADTLGGGHKLCLWGAL